MEQMEDALRALLSRALSEGEARDLAGITIESSWQRFAPRLCAVFSDGYRTSQLLRPSTCFAFCERHAVWDVEALRERLLCEAQHIYAQILQEQRVPCEVAGQAWLPAVMRRLRIGLSRWRRQHLPMMEAVGTRRFLEDREAWARGLRLLVEQLSPEQRRQYNRSGYFDVTGGVSGKQYRIRQGSSMNIEQLDKKGRRVCTLCFTPRGGLVTGDVMLAQKVALEAFEREALRIANKFY